MSGTRKDEHLRIAMEQHLPRPNDWDDVEFIHHALRGIDARDVRLDTTVAGMAWPVPFYINGMTGGTETTARINATIAEAAAATGVPVASGSMSIALREPEVMPSFTVLRERNPHGIVMTNMSADHPPERALALIEAMRADAIQIHINAVQETVMPEGSRGFDRWADHIAALTNLPVPVIVKEVGFGLSRETLSLLWDLGVPVADIAGTGGTDFARIENARRPEKDFAYLAGFGQSAPLGLLDAPSPAPELLGSGGVRSPLDIVRGLALGARAVGVAGVFLYEAATGGDLEGLLVRWKEQLRALLAMLGAPTPAALRACDVLVTGRLAERARLRRVDLVSLANRGSA